ncbi:MAG TPA: hypothetical protein VD994_07490, partial [Prosthecobacter sp.]|nr:hypothetical protein [Prosthecobacter sp.]
RVVKAAEHLRDQIAAATPRRTGALAKKISVVKGEHRLHRRVYLPFPAGFLIRGFMAGGKKYVPANPFPQRVLLQEQPTLDQIILGK